MRCAEKVKTVLSGRVSQTMCLSPALHLQTIKLGCLCWMPRISDPLGSSPCYVEHPAPSIYILSVAPWCNALEAVVVEPTLKSFRRDKFPKGRFWRGTPFQNGVYWVSERDSFSLSVGARVRARVYVCAWAWGERKKTTRNPVTRSSGQFYASCVTLFVELHTCLTRCNNTTFPPFVHSLWRSAVLNWNRLKTGTYNYLN